MVTCTFFGHSDCPDEVEPVLTATLAELIIKHHVTMFYVGNQGRFDQIVLKVLRILKSVELVEFDYAVVLAYMPEERRFVRYVEGETMLPEGIEEVYPKFAISWRNDWMIQHSDYVVTYIKHPWGGAAKYAGKAQRKGKKIIKLGI